MEATCKLGEKGCWNDGKCRATLNCECKVITNADRIRAMTDEELAVLLLDGCRGSKCGEQPQNEHGSVNCFSCRLDWLKQPVKDGEDDG